AERFEERLRLLDPATAHREVLHRPKGADAERRLTGRFAAPIAVEQAVPCPELLSNARPRQPHALRGGGFEAVPGEEEKAGIDAFAIQMCGVASNARIPSPLPHRIADQLPVLREEIHGDVEKVSSNVESQEFVERDPTERERVGVVPPTRPGLPDPFVRL